MLGLNISQKKVWFLIFAFCIIYWAYLIFHTKMVVVFDSIDYENTGKLIYQNGWIDFFRTGPHREPLYPALIALSMACANFLSLDYQLILKVFQVVLLFLTQILLVLLLKKINIRQGISKAAVLYFGISPAVINAAFSVYYEIVVFPFVVAAVLLASSLWYDIYKKRKYGLILWKTVLFGVCFSLLVLGRGVFQIVFYFFILIYCVLAVLAFFKRRRGVLRRLVIFISIAFVIFYSTVSYIKSMNLRYNGENVICRTHLSIFLACAYKRSQPVTPRIIATHIALIPGTGVCQMFFSQQECDNANFYGVDLFRTREVGQIMTTIPNDRMEFEVTRLALEKIIAHPFQSTFYSVVEASKMPFWESTKIGFVSYPEFLTKLYNHPIARFGLRLFFGILSMAGFIFVTLSLWRLRHQQCNIGNDRGDMITLFFVWLMMAAYTFCYALCLVITRYALPIASMYIVCISFTINSIFCRRSVRL